MPSIEAASPTRLRNLLVGSVAQAKAEAQIVRDRHVRIERVVLEHESEIAVARIDLVGALAADDGLRPR